MRSESPSRTLGSEPEDPFDELSRHLSDARRALQQCFTGTGGGSSGSAAAAGGSGGMSLEDAYFKHASTLLKPLLQMAEAVKAKAAALRLEQDNAHRIAELKQIVYTKCHQLGEDPAGYVRFETLGAAATFQESVDRLRASIRELDQLEATRLDAINAVIADINAVRAELEEGQPLPPARRPMPAVVAAAASPRSPMRRAAGMQGTAGPYGNGGGSGSGAVSRFDALYGGAADAIEAVESSESPLDADLSTQRIAQLKTELASVQERRAARRRTVAELCGEILALWREDGRVPNPADESLSDIERRLIGFAKAGAPMSDLGKHVDLRASTLQQLLAKKKAMASKKEERLRASLEMSKRLKLIEDRQFIVAAMKRIEARSKNPLRLFGSSEQLLREDEFRARMYPRLLLIESVLRPALVQYKEKQHRPFLYQGVDFLKLLDEELKTRVVPRHLFPLAPSPLQQHRSLRGLPDAVLRVLSAGAEDKQGDFARVLQLSVTVDGAVSEYVLSQQERADDLRWSEGALKSDEQTAAEQRELQLLQLGWRLPEGMPPERLLAISPHRARSAGRVGNGAGASATSPRPPLIPQLLPPASVPAPGTTAAQAGSGSATTSGGGGGGDLIDEDGKLMVPVPPPADIAPRKCRERHSGHAPCRPSLLATESTPTSILAAPHTSRVLPEKVLLRGARVATALDAKPQRVRINAVQLANIRAPKHIRYSETDGARKLKAEVDAAYRYK